MKDKMEKITCAIFARIRTALFFSYKSFIYELVNIMNYVPRYFTHMSDERVAAKRHCYLFSNEFFISLVIIVAHIYLACQFSSKG